MYVHGGVDVGKSICADCNVLWVYSTSRFDVDREELGGFTNEATTTEDDNNDDDNNDNNDTARRATHAVMIWAASLQGVRAIKTPVTSPSADHRGQPMD